MHFPSVFFVYFYTCTYFRYIYFMLLLHLLDFCTSRKGPVIANAYTLTGNFIHLFDCSLMQMFNQSVTWQLLCAFKLLWWNSKWALEWGKWFKWLWTWRSSWVKWAAFINCWSTEIFLHSHLYNRIYWVQKTWNIQWVAILGECWCQRSECKMTQTALSL